MRPLTEKQKNILDFIIACVNEEHYTPTVREIANQFGIKSPNAVRNHLDAIEKKGHITKKAGASRGIELADEYLEKESGIPIIGRVAAGAPITASENMDGYLTIDGLFSSSDRLYALRVNGDSMIDAGIWDGDYAIVKAQEDVEQGEIGVAIVNEEATVKRIKRNGNVVELVPENESYSPIIVDLEYDSFRIGGKVVGIHRVIS
jgi:repressor LexA